MTRKEQFFLSGLKSQYGRSDREIVTELIGNIGVECEIRNVKRLQSYNTKPGLVKCEVSSVEEKINILRNKRNLQDAAPNVYMRSSKSHTERLLEANTKTILNIIKDQLNPDSFRLTANGRLIEKEYGEGNGYTDPEQTDQPLSSQIADQTSDRDHQEVEYQYPQEQYSRGRGPRGGPKGGPRGGSRGGPSGGHRDGQRGGPRGGLRGGSRGRGYRGRPWSGQYNRNNNYNQENPKKRDRPGSVDTPPREPPKQPQFSPTSMSSTNDLIKHTVQINQTVANNCVGFDDSQIISQSQNEKSV